MNLLIFLIFLVFFWFCRDKIIIDKSSPIAVQVVIITIVAAVGWFFVGS